MSALTTRPKLRTALDGSEALSRILARGGGIQTGTGHLVPCVAHDDRNPSMSVTVKDGRLLFYCHAGCSQDAIMSVLFSLGIFSRSDEERVSPVRRRINQAEVKTTPAAAVKPAGR